VLKWVSRLSILHEIGLYLILGISTPEADARGFIQMQITLIII